MPTNTNGVQVLCRVRPHSETRGDLNRFARWEITASAEKNSILATSADSEKIFSFDKLFLPTATQQDVFSHAAAPVVDDVLRGYNGTVMVYGQTSSGKTFTMQGPDIDNDDKKGIIPRVAKKLFASGETVMTVKCSFFEIYQERIYDLLNDIKPGLYIKETADSVTVVGATERVVSNATEFLEVVRLGCANRLVAATRMNVDSSRSHSIFSASVEVSATATSPATRGTLYLVDLAGSENLKRSGATGVNAAEARQINRSLFALGTVIHALTSGPTRSHVPYRDSMLTRVLRDAFGGNSKTALILTCSMRADCLTETLSTLRFGERAKLVQNSAQKNDFVVSTGETDRLMKRIQELEETVRVQQDRIAQLVRLVDAPAMQRARSLSDNERANPPSTNSPQASGASLGRNRSRSFQNSSTVGDIIATSPPSCSPRQLCSADTGSNTAEERVSNDNQNTLSVRIPANAGVECKSCALLRVELKEKSNRLERLQTRNMDLVERLMNGSMRRSRPASIREPAEKVACEYPDLSSPTTSPGSLVTSSPTLLVRDAMPGEETSAPIEGIPEGVGPRIVRVKKNSRSLEKKPRSSSFRRFFRGGSSDSRSSLGSTDTGGAGKKTLSRDSFVQVVEEKEIEVVPVEAAVEAAMDVVRRVSLDDSPSASMEKEVRQSVTNARDALVALQGREAASVVWAAKTLADLSLEGEHITTAIIMLSGAPSLLHLLQTPLMDPLAVSCVLSCVCEISRCPTLQDALINAGVIQFILGTLRGRHDSSVVCTVLGLLRQFSLNPSSRRLLVQADVLNNLIDILRDDLIDSEVGRAEATGTIWNLCADASTKMAVAKNGGLCVLLELLRKETDWCVKAKAAGALKNLLSVMEIASEFLAAGGLDDLLVTLRMGSEMYEESPRNSNSVGNTASDRVVCLRQTAGALRNLSSHEEIAEVVSTAGTSKLCVALIPIITDERTLVNLLTTLRHVTAIVSGADDFIDSGGLELFLPLLRRKSASSVLAEVAEVLAGFAWRDDVRTHLLSDHSAVSRVVVTLLGGDQASECAAGLRLLLCVVTDVIEEIIAAGAIQLLQTILSCREQSFFFARVLAVQALGFLAEHAQARALITQCGILTHVVSMARGHNGEEGDVARVLVSSLSAHKELQITIQEIDILMHTPPDDDLSSGVEIHKLSPGAALKPEETTSISPRSPAYSPSTSPRSSLRRGSFRSKGHHASLSPQDIPGSGASTPIRVYNDTLHTRSVTAESQRKFVANDI